MTETPAAYTARMLSLIGERDPQPVLAATASHLVRTLDGLSHHALSQRPTPDKWSIVEILAHLADCEVVAGWRIRQVLAAPGITLEAFDQNAWAESGHYAERDPDRSLAQFRALRAVNLEVLKHLRPEQWQLWGVHAERGKESITHIVAMLAGHDLNHLAQIEALASTARRQIL